jgi:molecular chaperone GrpE
MTDHNERAQNAAQNAARDRAGHDESGRNRPPPNSGRADTGQNDTGKNDTGQNDTGRDQTGRDEGGWSGAGQGGAVRSDTPAPVSVSDERVAELEDRWLRAVAELDNLRKRTLRDIERQRAEERARVAAEWLPILDNLDLALQHADADPSAVIQGVRAVRDQAVALLNRLGFPRQDQVGVRFDPARHEAVSTVADADAEPGTVTKVLRPGYGNGERQLRPAAVVVATKAD